MSEEFAKMWAAHDVRRPTSRVKVLRHASAGDLAFSVTGLNLAATPEARLVVYTPADDQATRRLDWVLHHPDAPITDHLHPNPPLPNNTHPSC